MRQGLRKFALTIHITLSVGWIGAVLAYLVLVFAALTSGEVLTLRAAWIGMDLIGWYLIVPLAITSLLSGLVMSAGTRWGLLRHYWVLASLALTLVATAVLLQHMPTVSALAGMAAGPALPDVSALRDGLRGELLHAGLGLLVLLVIEALNVYKPLGLTAYGRRRLAEGARVDRVIPRQEARQEAGSRSTTPRWVPVVGYHAVGLVLLFVIMHFSGGGTRPH